MAKQFLSGDEAFAYGIRLARPHVISAYPITPQTIVVEKLSEFVEDGSLQSEFIHVESEHSAMPTVQRLYRGIYTATKGIHFHSLTAVGFRLMQRMHKRLSTLRCLGIT